MDILNKFYACPENCGEEITLTPIAADPTCIDYDQLLAEIQDFVLWMDDDGSGNPVANPIDWANASLVAGAIDNTATDNSKARWYRVIGELPDPEQTERVYPGGFIKVTKNANTLTMEIYDMSDEMYNHLLALQCGTIKYSFYFADIAGSMYGGPDGIRPKKSTITFPKGKGDAVRFAKWVVTYDSTGDPLRIDNPLAA